MSNLTLSQIDNSVQLGLRNVVGSPLSQNTRVEAYNRVIDFLQSKANWRATQKVFTFDYLNGEVDYSLTDLGLTDFKQYRDLRFVNSSNVYQIEEFEEIDNNSFSVVEGRNAKYNVIAFEDRSGVKFMRIISNKGSGDTIVDSMEDLTTNRTWASDTTNSDATTLAVDDTRVKVGSNCLKFNITVAQSVNNYARIYTSTGLTTTIDGSDLLNNGYFRFWLGLHSLTSTQLGYISSVDFYWGSSSSAYWSKNVTVPANNGTFKAGWNRMNFDWASATKTGSPDESALAYFEIRVNFSASMTDATNIRVDEIKMFTPFEMELIYFSSNMVSKSGTWQDLFTTTVIDTAETLLFPPKHSNLFINLALQRLFPKKDKSDRDYVRVTEEIKYQLPLAINQDGVAILMENQQFKVRGDSNGREEISGTQW